MTLCPICIGTLGDEITSFGDISALDGSMSTANSNKRKRKGKGKGKKRAGGKKRKFH